MTSHKGIKTNISSRKEKKRPPRACNTQSLKTDQPKPDAQKKILWKV